MAPVASRLGLIVLNLLALALTVPFAFTTLIAGVFASDSGPNPVSSALLATAFIVPLLVLVLAVVAQIRRSRRWAIAALILPALPLAALAVLTALATVGAMR